MKVLENGFWSGIMATGPMTLWMLATDPEGKPLPPAQLTDELTPDKVKPNTPESRGDLSLLSHFAFGIGAATIYSFIASIKPPSRANHALIYGSAFGFGVWATSYLGWIPAMNLKAKAKEQSLGRNAMMITAHLIWGSAVGYSEFKLRSAGERLLDGKG